MWFAVIGSREYPWVEQVIEVMYELSQLFPDCTVISGGADGVDSWVEERALILGLRFEKIMAPWEHGGGAGRARNREVVGRADYVIAFWDGLSPGTANAISIARELGKPLWVVKP